MKIYRTICAGCNEMWDGFGLPCPRLECGLNTTHCSWYSPMSDKQLAEFAPQFWDDTFAVRGKLVSARPFPKNEPIQLTLNL